MRHYAVVAALLMALHAPAGAEPSLCASPEQAASVQALYAREPAPPTFMVAAQLGVSEAIVASALAGKQTVGTSGAGFAAIWESLAEWESATVVLLKGGLICSVLSTRSISLVRRGLYAA